MKVFLGLCVLAIIAGAFADCGCLKCNPNLQVVSPRYSPCKVIFRNNNLNLPSIAPYKLQAAVPPPPPVYVPKEYDYQMQFLPYANPYMGSVYEYGLQAAVVPPPGPLHIPLKNLRTGVERVVMDAPANSLGCGTSTCHPGFFKKAPLPAPLPIHLHHHHHHDCGCDSCRRDSYGYDSYEGDSCSCDACQCDSCNRERTTNLKEEDDDYKGPIIEPLLPPLCSRYAQNFIRNLFHSSRKMLENNLNSNCKKFRRKRDLLGTTNHVSRTKRDIIDLPMNFMFKFIPNLLRGPIIHAINTIQHNVNPAVVRARVNANKHKIQINLVKSKHKMKLHNNHIPRGSIKISKPLTKPLNTLNLHQSFGKSYPLDSTNYDPKTERLPPSDFSKLSTKTRNFKSRKEKTDFGHFVTSEPTKRLGYQRVDDEIGRTSLKYWSIQPNFKNKYNIGDSGRDALDENIVGKTNDVQRKILSSFDLRKRLSREYLNHQRHRPVDEMKNSFLQRGYSDEDIIRGILLAKMQRFNEMYENGLTNSMEPCKDKIEAKSRKRRGILLDTNQFQLPFFEIEDEVLDNYNHDSQDQIVELKHKKRKRRKHYDDSELESGEEVLGAGHPLYDHPFVVLLRTPLKLLHHFHDIRKNFHPILYSFPKILQSSRRYLKDFGKNLQTGVLDFASNIMGDFSSQVPKSYDSFLMPSRQRRSLIESLPRNHQKIGRNKRYILKVVDEKEVQEFLEEKLGGYFDDEDEEKEDEEDKIDEEREKNSEERVGKAESKKQTEEKKFIVKKLSPKLILDNNGKPFIEINGNKRPLFFGKNKHKSPILQKSKQKTHEAITSNSGEDETIKEEDNKHRNGKLDEIIAQAKQKLSEEQILKSVNCDEMPTQTIKEKINQISSYIQDLVNLDCSKYADLFENLSKLEKMRKTIAEYWKKVMINEKTNDIQCKIKILKSIREMQNEKDETTKKIAEILKTGDNFIVKKLVKLLVRLQKLQCLIQKVVDHFENRMKIGTISDTEKEIKFVDFLSSLSFESAKSEEEFVSSLKKEKHEYLHKEIQFLENLRLLLQKDDIYITNEVAKQIWEMRNIEKLQQEAIEEMNAKLENNMKIRKELKILFDLLKQIEGSEDACEKLLQNIGEKNKVGSKLFLRNSKRQKQSLSEILEKFRQNTKSTLAARKLSRKAV